MSDKEEVTPPAEGEKTSSRRRLRRRGPKKAAEGGEDSEGKRTEEREKREPLPRPESVPIPSEMVGKVSVGYITAIIKKGKVRFGFIHLGEELSQDPATPRVYFSFLELADKTVTLRKGYNVQFTTKLDDKDRQFAAEVSLTEQGVEEAATREAEIAEKKKMRAEEENGGKSGGEDKEGAGDAPRRKRRERKKRTGVEGEDGEKRERKPRTPRPEKNVTLAVTCEGYAETKEVVFNANQSLGKLKKVTTSEFGAPITFQVFTSAGSKELLTKSLLLDMEDGAAVHLAPPLEGAEEEEAA